ncbi:MAG: hypothetical protein KDD09_08350 [Phaeodactylibacter sp.]|nr:hypothetical protein [Phaeodactylibacter sp.]
MRCVFPKDGSFFWKMPASSAILAFFNRVAGLDYNLASSDNRWNGKAFYHRAFTPEVLDDQFSHGPRIDFTFSRSLFLTVFLQYNDQLENININTRL